MTEVSQQPVTRDRLMRAAMAIVAADGLAAATTAAIAQKAGVAEGTLYRHFDSKDDLLIAIYRQLKSDVFLKAAAGVDVSARPPQRLKLTWRAIYDAYRQDIEAFLFAQRFMESALAEREGGEAGKAIAAMVADLRQAGIETGDFKPLAADLLGDLFLAPISYLLKHEIRGRRWSDEELDAASEAVLAGWRK
ncbi:MAG: TetR/AcrR family transcriptional regulator [Rhodomicrobium sp.]|nr:TetR/AcrR family transcriptional regulator [Rhodomicrobium sp.]